MNMLNGVVFDFNGTLFFDSEYHLAAFDALKMEICGEHMDMREMEKTCAGVPNVEIFRRLSNGRFTQRECEMYSARKEQMYRDLVMSTPGGAHLCPGCNELFDYLLDNRIPFTIASASIKENIDFFVDTFHLEWWLDPSTIVYDDGSYQDKTEMYIEAFFRLGAIDHQLVFEDSLSGIKGADLAGARILAIENPALMDEFTKYRSIIGTIRDMSEALPFVETMRYTNMYD